MMQPAETHISSLTLKPTLTAACRDICNCSSENCQRKSKGLRSTGQLANEAHKQGFTSVSLACLHPDKPFVALRIRLSGHRPVREANPACSTASSGCQTAKRTSLMHVGCAVPGGLPDLLSVCRHRPPHMSHPPPLFCRLRITWC